jgi:Ca2+-binding EF-hand superfamily protein
MRFVLIAAALALAGAGLAQQPPADYVKRVGDAYRSAFAAADVGRKGYITREDLVGSNFMLPVFDSMDVNRDGRVTAGELERFLADLPARAA